MSPYHFCRQFKKRVGTTPGPTAGSGHDGRRIKTGARRPRLWLQRKNVAIDHQKGEAMKQTTAGIRELKNHLSAYLRKVKAGEPSRSPTAARPSGASCRREKRTSARWRRSCRRSRTPDSPNGAARSSNRANPLPKTKATAWCRTCFLRIAGRSLHAALSRCKRTGQAIPERTRNTRNKPGRRRSGGYCYDHRQPPGGSRSACKSGARGSGRPSRDPFSAQSVSE